MADIKAKLKARLDTTANWTSANPILLSGEIGVEQIDGTGIFKIGDGVSTWTTLPYARAVAADVSSWAKAVAKPSYTYSEVGAAPAGNYAGSSTQGGDATNALSLGGTAASSYVTLAGSQALTNKTYNGYTLGAACAKAVDTIPTNASVNVITSGGVYTSLTSKLDLPNGLTAFGATLDDADIFPIYDSSATTYLKLSMSQMRTYLNNYYSLSGHTHNYAGSASAGGPASTALALNTARSIALSGDITGSVNFDGSAGVTIASTLATVVTAGTYTKLTVDAKGRTTSGATLSATDIPSLDMSKVSTGNLSTLRLVDPDYVTGSVTPTTIPLFDVLRADRLTYLPAAQIIIENSTDAGATWTDAGVSDSNKKKIFTAQRPNITIPLKAGVKSTDCMMRITITGMTYNVPEGTAETSKYDYWNSTYVTGVERYVSLSHSWIWVNSSTDRIYCKVERATGASPNTWFAVREAFMSGWTGGNYIQLDGNVFGGGTNQTTKSWNWRFTFRTATNLNDFNSANLSASYTTAQQSILQIKATGINCWFYSNQLMFNDHAYVMDENFTATFPGAIISSAFYGNASTATKLQTAANVTIGNTSKLFDGSGPQGWSLGEIGASAVGHTHIETDISFMSQFAKANLLRNSDFYDGMVYSSWASLNGPTLAYGSVVSGRGIMGITSTGNAADSYEGIKSNKTDNGISCSTGDVFTASTYLLITNESLFEGRGVGIRAKIYDSSDALLETFTQEITTLTSYVNVWKRLTLTFTVAAATASYVLLEIYIVRNGVLNVANPKLEYGYIATEWVKNYFDPIPKYLGGTGQHDGSATPISHRSTSSATYGAASASYYGHAMASSATPLVAGTASVGSDNAKYAREGHVHPAQTTISGYLPLSGGTMTGSLVCNTDTDYTTGRARNIVLQTGTPTVSASNNGWLYGIYV